MSILDELRNNFLVYKQEFKDIIRSDEARRFDNYEFKIGNLNVAPQDLEVAVTDRGKIMAGYLNGDTFILALNLEKIVFAKDRPDQSYRFTKHKEFIPKLGVDVYEDESGSVVRLTDGRIVTMLNDGTIIDK